MSLKEKVFSSIIWTFFEMFGGQLINFFVNMILARKLVPEDYGVIGMMYIFITISNTLMDSGLSPSLMRRKTLESIDYSTTFTTHLLFSFLFYSIIFLLAPFIAEFYQRNDLVNIIRVFSIIIILQGTVQIHSVYLMKKLNFKKQTLIKLPSIIISSLIAIYLAYNGYGVWSLIWMYIIQNFLWSLFHWLFGEWKVSIAFSMPVFNEHFNYGYKISLVEILNNITNNIYQIVLGKFYQTKYVGYYTQSLTLYQVPFSNIFMAIVKVLFPVFAEIQDDLPRLKKNFMKCLETLIMIMFPIFIFLLFNAEDILVILFTDKWKFAAIYLQCLCFAALFNLVTYWELLILRLLKESDKILKYELILKAGLFVSIFLVVSLYKEVKFLLFTIPFVAFMSFIYINLKSTNSLKISYIKPISTILIYLLLCVLPIFIIRWLVFDNLFVQLTIKGIMFFLVYGLLIFLFRRNQFFEIIKLVKK